MDWQPIETAPKDGTPVLVYARRTPRGKSRLFEAWRCVARREATGHLSSGWHTIPSDYAVEPTHWMPLPKLPTHTGTP